MVILACCCFVILVGDVTFKGLPKADLALASVALPFLLAVLAIQSIYQGFREFKVFNRITLAQAALPLLLIGIAIGLGGGVRAAILATVVAVALLFVAVIVHVQRSTGIVWRAKLADLQPLFSFGLRVHPANVLAYLGYRLDVFLVDGYKGAAAVGLYGAGVVIAEGLWMPSQGRQHGALPDHRRGDE